MDPVPRHAEGSRRVVSRSVSSICRDYTLGLLSIYMRPKEVESHTDTDTCYSHEHAPLYKINKFGLLYTVQGSDNTLKPILLTAHQDVVPVEDETKWEYPPFGGHFDGEHIWGRGSSDKDAITALMSAMEALLSEEDYEPKRTVIMAFGFDEECNGLQGASSIAEHLEETYGKDGIAVILDEGGGGLQSLDDTLYALPAVYEKGYLDVWFDVEVVGGRADVPPPHTSIGMMSEIVVELEALSFEPAIRKDSPVYDRLVCQARYTPYAQPKLTNMLRRGDLNGLAYELAVQDDESRYRIQTSSAVTMIRGGKKLNALPEIASLGVNYRHAPQDNAGSVQHRVVKAVGNVARKYGLRVEAFEDDEEYQSYVAALTPPDVPVSSSYPDGSYRGTLKLKTKNKSPATPISPTSGRVWDTLSGSIQHSFRSRGGIVVPVGDAMTGNTDTRYYLSKFSIVSMQDACMHARIT